MATHPDTPRLAAQRLIEAFERGLEECPERFRALIRATVVNAITDKSRPATTQGA